MKSTSANPQKAKTSPSSPLAFPLSRSAGEGSVRASRFTLYFKDNRGEAVPVKQTDHLGPMLPATEDKRLAQPWNENTYGIDALLAYSAVCGTGLDTVPLPGDISEERLVQIYGDVAALAWKWKKPLSARLQPVKGKGVGEKTEFESPYLFNATLRPN